ncbi:Uncharacterized protein OBRU01_22878, partial [Operophtera brumata]
MQRSHAKGADKELSR